ncbi:MAG: PIN domain-containing protein [Spirochaetota bacterium]
MICYFDTSFLLSAVLEQHPEVDYDVIWQNATEKLSSHLIKIESAIALRRAAAGFSVNPQRWAKRKLTELGPFLNAITCKFIDESIEDIILNKIELAQCRCLDAIHLSTALYFQSYLRETLFLCTLDKRMREIAGTLDFSVLPEKLD